MGLIRLGVGKISSPGICLHDDTHDPKTNRQSESGMIFLVSMGRNHLCCVKEAILTLYVVPLSRSADK